MLLPPALPPCDNDSMHVHSQTVASPQWLTASETGGNVAATLVGGIAGSLDDVRTVCAYTHTRMHVRVWVCVLIMQV